MAPPNATDRPTDTNLDFEPSQPPRQGFGRFLRDVLIVSALIGGALWFYQSSVTTREQVEKLADSAIRDMKKNDLQALQRAEATFKEALELSPDDGRIEAYLAETYLMQHAIHGLDTLKQAKQHFAVADEQDVQSSARFATSAYILIEDGQPEKAEKDVKSLLDSEKSGAALAHALGWAKMEQGDHIEAARLLGTAADGAYGTHAYSVTLAQNSHRQGVVRAAIKHLDSIIRSTMNPDHDMARAYLAALRLQTYGNLSTPFKLITDLKESTRPKGPVTEAFTAWADAEMKLAIGNTKEALEALATAKEKLPDYPPFFATEARIKEASGDVDAAVAAYEKALSMKPAFRGIKWDLARLKSKRKDDAALTLVEELEKSEQGLKGPEFEVFRGQHQLNKGDLEAATAHFTAAAELGDDPDILLGLAKVAFEEEQKKGKKADLEKVAEPLQRAMDAKKYFPEAQEFYGDLNLWNYVIDAANAAYGESEKHAKKLKMPIPEVLAFYDRVIARFEGVKERRLRKQAGKLADEWKTKKAEYVASLAK